MHPRRSTPYLFATLGLTAACAQLALPALGQRGVQVNTDPATFANIPGDAANEPTLAISPVDPDGMVIGWRQFPSVTSDKRFAGFAWSDDGGETWFNGGRLATPPGVPFNAGQTDPVLDVDSDGVFYYWSEVFEPVQDTSHHVYRSLDGGRTWLTPVQVQDPAVDGDKEWMIIDRTGGLGDGHVYGGWASFAGAAHHVFTRSIDGGLTFSAPVRIADRGGTQFMLHYDIGPEGELYAAWRHYSSNSIYVTKSTNANDPLAMPSFDAFGAGGFSGVDIRLDDGNDPGFIAINPVGFHQVWLGVDVSNGPRRGAVYCLWADNRFDVSDVLFARSTDGGFTWQTGIRVNDDAIGSGAYQWMVAMDVAPNGRIDAVWYDTRDNPVTDRSALYYAHSLDGGVTWSVNRRISDDFDTTVGYPAQQKIGDYTQIISQNDAVNIAYAATFNGEQDIWFLRISPYEKGDLNCDGLIDNEDIDPFVLALTDPRGYRQAFPNCDLLNGDITGDGLVDNEDIDPFVRLISGPNW